MQKATALLNSPAKPILLPSPDQWKEYMKPLLEMNPVAGQYATWGRNMFRGMFLERSAPGDVILQKILRCPSEMIRLKWVDVQQDYFPARAYILLSRVIMCYQKRRDTLENATFCTHVCT